MAAEGFAPDTDFRARAMMPGAATTAAESIVQASLAGLTEAEQLAELCQWLNRDGFSLSRASIASDLLDPTFDGRGVIWRRDQGSVEETFVRDTNNLQNESWTRSPFFALLEGDQPVLRRRLDASHRRGEFPLLDEFKDQGATDYVAFLQRLGGNLRIGEGQGMVASWTTDVAGGFSDVQLALLHSMMPTLTLAMMLRTTHRNARTMITTYLGADAAERVLAGNIVRGRAETIRAVVWYSDLIGFTRISDAARPDVVLSMLNDYADAQVQAIDGQGGHVLKFIGDGILAIFPDADPSRACARALDAAADQRRRIGELNRQRLAAAAPVTDTHLALHVGELLYGNVGSPRRLDFTVLGPAVNEAARIEALCGSLEQAVIVSEAFADAAGDARSRLVSLGRYAIKGVARPQHLYTLDPGDPADSGSDKVRRPA